MTFLNKIINQNPSPISSFSKSNENLLKINVEMENPYLVPQKVDFKKLISVPYDITSDVMKWTKAYIFEDEEAQLEAVTDITNGLDISITSTNLFFGIFSYLDVFLRTEFEQFNFYPATIARILSVPFAIIGLVLSVIESIYEIYNICQSGKMLCQLNKEGPNLSREVLREKLERIYSKYLKLSPQEINKIHSLVETRFSESPISCKESTFNEIATKRLQIKYAQLARRVSPWCAKEILLTSADIIKDLNSNDSEIQNRGINAANELLSQMSTQCIKKLIIHSLALAVIFLSVIGLSFMLAGVIYSGYLLAILGILGGAIALVRYLMSRGVLTQKGWNFSLENCVPSAVKKLGRKFFHPLKSF